MGQAERNRQQTARQRIAMQQAAQQPAEQQRRMLTVGGAIVPVIVLGADLRNSSSPVARAIIGAANHITAAICKVTNGQPGNVCKSTSVTSVGGSI